MILASAFLNQVDNRSLALKPIYLLYGEESLFLRDSFDGLRGLLQEKGYLFGDRFDVDSGFDWQGLQMETQAGSLFAEQRVVLVSMPKGNPGKEGTQFIQQWANSQAGLQMDPEVIVIIECEKLDSRQSKAKWVQAIESAGLVVQAKPVPTNALPRWCQERAARQGLQLDNEAASLLAERTEGNLLAADQEITKLSLLYNQQPQISAEIIADNVVDQAHYQLFALASAMLLGRAEYALQILQRLRQEGIEAPIVLWLLSKEVRQLWELSGLLRSMSQAQAYKKMRIWSSRQQEVGQALNRHSAQMWSHLLKQSLEVDLKIKGIRKTTNEDEIWSSLAHIVSQIARSN